MPAGPGAPMPPQGAPAQAPSAPPQGGPPPQGPQGGGAGQLVSQAHQALSQLQKLVHGAPVSPQDKQGIDAIVNGFQAWVQEMGKPQGQAPQGPPAAGPKPPMPAHAGPGAKPMPPGQ
jgi:hypothetical protein